MSSLLVSIYYTLSVCVHVKKRDRDFLLRIYGWPKYRERTFPSIFILYNYNHLLFLADAVFVEKGYR